MVEIDELTGWALKLLKLRDEARREEAEANESDREADPPGVSHKQPPSTKRSNTIGG